MAMKLKVISNSGETQEQYKVLLPEDTHRHFRNVTGSVIQDAQDTWGEIWDQFQGSVTHGKLIDPDVENGWKPECGWPEFLEKMWLLKHYLDYAKRFCEGKT